MKSITIHGLDDPLDTLIRERARKQNLSLNKTIKQLLAQSLGLSNKPEKSRKELFADLCGVWTNEDREEFVAATRDLNTVDPNDWS